MAALVAMASTELVGTILIEGEHPPFALVIELPLVLLAALVATGRRWAGVIAAVVSGILVVATAVGSNFSKLDVQELLVAAMFVVFGVTAVTASVATIRVAPGGPPLSSERPDDAPKFGSGK